MKIDNLKLLYLYCYERLKKSLNRKNNNNLSFIESMFIEISLNDFLNKNCEWYNFICNYRRYYQESKKNYFKELIFIFNAYQEKENISIF